MVISKLLRVSAPNTPSSGPDPLLRGTSTRRIVKLRSSNSPAGMSPVIPCVCLPHDSGLLRADPLRSGRRQYGCLGAGIEEKKAQHQFDGDCGKACGEIGDRRV